MCGINGIISLKKILNIEDRVKKMNDSLLHRGPDAEGIEVLDDNRVALGHRRLSIIDISASANQPMVSNSGNWHIVFNGEIYNFKEIRACLNYEFKTSSDTEVILAAIEIKGLDWFLERANGMFAIALFDSSTGNFYLMRDRLGIKPLYYFKNDEYLIFSSEVKGILSSGLIHAEFNELAIDEYLANRYIRAPYTFFKDIYQLDPGAILSVNKNLSIKKSFYWHLPNEFNFETSYNENELISDFEGELTKAIRYRLISDVPLGTYLSGGVDSSLITAITAKNKDESINTYTIGFEELNEFDYSRVVAEKYKTTHHEILISKNDYLQNWDKLIYYKDAPLGVPNEIPLAIMSRVLKEKITVVLSGEGADELLGGYGRIFRSPFDYKNHKPEMEFYDFFVGQYEYVPRQLRDMLLSTPTSYRAYFDHLISEDFEKYPNEQNVFRFFHQYHVKGLLQRVDTTTMQTSVEARVPFLDHNLVEYSYRNIPYEMKLKWKNNNSKIEASTLKAGSYSERLDIPKYLLRKLSYKYLDKSIIERKKLGFPVPLTNWFGGLEEIAHDLLGNADWLKANTLQDLINDSKKEDRAGQILWMFINVEMFKKSFFKKQWKW